MANVAAEFRHGMSRTSVYRIWKAMISRCHNPNASGFYLYGARGIAVCPEWRHDFMAFFSEVGPRPSPRHSIDRIDNERGYEPGNVRWATQAVQCRNSRRNRWIEIRGVRRVVTDWATHYGINIKTFEKRLRSGWSPVEAAETPVRTWR